MDVPATIAGYEILDKIGHGGIAVVYRARQISLDRIVALKLLSPKLMESERHQLQLVEEARSAARLNHPNIVQGIDVGEADGFIFYAMEYVVGGNVQTRIQESGPMEEVEAWRIAFGIAHALDHAHFHEILHRDVKPANILVDRFNRAKLCDLGLATGTAFSMDGAAGRAVGTPHYMSPEQATGAKILDIRTDIYSFGVSLYHMLSGIRPFTGKTGREVMLQQVSGTASPLRRLRPELSPLSEHLVSWMMQKERDARPEHPGMVIENIEAILNNLKPEVLGAELIEIEEAEIVGEVMEAEEVREIPRAQTVEAGDREVVEAEEVKDIKTAEQTVRPDQVVEAELVDPNDPNNRLKKIRRRARRRRRQR